MAEDTPLVQAQPADVEGARDVHVHAARLSATNVSRRDYGIAVKIRNNCYVQTNHYIRSSRGFVRKPDGKLHEFWYFFGMRGLFLSFVLLGVALGWLHLISAIVFLLIGLLWVPVFAQHLFVIGYTMPYIMKQRVVSNREQLSVNKFVEYKITELEGVFLEAYQAGVGSAVAGEIAGAEMTIKMQIFNERAQCYMYKSMVLSIIFAILSLQLVTWCIMWISIIGGILSHNS